MRVSLTVTLAAMIFLADPLPKLVNAAEIKVISSPGASSALRAVAPHFERSTGHTVVLSFANIAALNKRIASGEVFDIAIVSPNLIDELLKQGQIIAGTKLNVGRTGLGVVTRKGAAHPSIDSVDAFKSALLGAKMVGYSATGESGIAFLRVLEQLGIAAEMKPRVVPSKSLSSDLASGKVELGVTGVGAALSTPSLDYVGTLPSQIQQYVNLAAGVSAGATDMDAARALLRYLSDPEVVRVMAANGLEPY